VSPGILHLFKWFRNYAGFDLGWIFCQTFSSPSVETVMSDSKTFWSCKNATDLYQRAESCEDGLYVPLHNYLGDSRSSLLNSQKPQFLEDRSKYSQHDWKKWSGIRTAPVDCHLELVTTEIVFTFVTFKKSSVFTLKFFSSCDDFESFNQVTPDSSLYSA